MGLFGFGKKKHEAEKPACACQSGCPTAEVTPQEISPCCCNGNSCGEATIKVLGTGCASCHTLLENTKDAVAATGISATVEYVQDMATIASYGVMSVPALVVNEKVITMGKVLKKDEVEAILQKLGLSSGT